LSIQFASLKKAGDRGLKAQFINELNIVRVCRSVFKMIVGLELTASRLAAGDVSFQPEADAEHTVDAETRRVCGVQFHEMEIHGRATSWRRRPSPTMVLSLSLALRMQMFPHRAQRIYDLRVNKAITLAEN
jgi:hypothetical protein